MSFKSLLIVTSRSLLICSCLASSLLRLEAQGLTSPTIVPLSNTPTHLLIYASFSTNNAMGSNNAYPYVLDTGSFAFVTAHGTNTTNWGNSTYVTTTNNWSIKYEGKNSYQGVDAISIVSLTAPVTNPSNNVVPPVYSITNADFGVITNQPWPNWDNKINLTSPPTPPEPAGTFGTLGAGLSQLAATNGALFSVLGQVPVDTGYLDQGYIIHSGGAAATNASITIGLTQSNISTFPTLVAMNPSTGIATNNSGQTVTLYPEQQLTATMTLVNTQGTIFSTNILVIVDSGGLNGGVKHANADPNFIIPAEFLDSQNNLVAGDSFSLRVAGTGGKQGLDWTYTAGTNQYTNLLSFDSNSVGVINTGLTIYRLYDVMFDTTTGLMGFDPLNINLNSTTLAYQGSYLYQGAGSFSGSLGTNNNQIQWTGSGGFSAQGGDLTVNIGGQLTPSTLRWGQTNFLTDGQVLYFGSPTSDGTVLFQNGLDLNGTNQTILVTKGISNSVAGVNISGSISDGGLILGDATNTGTLILSGTNTYTGDTAIRRGILQLGGSGVLGSGSYSGSITNDGGFVDTSSTNQIFSGRISGSGSLTQSGNSTLTLSGSNTYTGTTMINGGTLQAGSTNALGAGTVVLGRGSQSATLSLATNLGIASLVWGSNGVVSLTPGSQVLSITGRMSNAEGGLLNVGNAPLSNATNLLISFGSQAGFTTNSFGVFGIQGVSFLLSSTNLSATIAPTASLVVSTNVTIGSSLQVGSFSLNGGGATISPGDSLSASGGITVNSGSLLNSGSITTTTLTVNVGSATVSSGATLNASNSVTVNGGVLTDNGTLNTTNLTENGGSITIGTGGTLNASNALTVNGGTLTDNGLLNTANLTIGPGGVLTGSGTIIDSLNNAGLIVMNNMTINETNGGVNNSGTITGSGVINGSVNNSGQIAMSGLTINAPDGGVNNSGTISGNGAINGSVNNSGQIVMNALTITGAANNSGTISGNGVINGNLGNSGTLFPGSASTPGTLTINGNLSESGSSTTVIAVAPSSNSQIAVSGAATLGGALTLLSLPGTSLSFGEKLSFLSASSISGGFSAINAPTGYRGRVDIFGDPVATILIAPASYTQVAQNRNQTNAATALNSFIPATSGDQLTVSTALDSLTTGQYGQAFNAIEPTFYQSLSTIAFNSATAQNSELVQRLWGLRIAEGGGFSMSGLPDSTPVIQEQGKGVLDAKKDILRPGADNHWGMFVDGNGIFAQANSANMLPGYQSESGGVTTGLTYRIHPSLSLGLYAGYEGTYAKYGASGSGLGVGSSLIDNSVRFGLFGTCGQKNSKGEVIGFYADAMAGGGYNNYQATRIIQFSGLNRTASSSPGAGELDTMLAGGYDMKHGNFTFGPTTSLQYTYLGVNPVNETGAQSLNFNSGGWNSASMISSVGAHVAYTCQASKNVVVAPQLSLNWQHEFMQNPYAINGTLGGSPSFSNWSAVPIRDTIYTGIGFTVDFYNRWNAACFYNVAAGNANLTSQNIFWSAGAKF